jgi:hypothetical protein
MFSTWNLVFVFLCHKVLYGHENRKIRFDLLFHSISILGHIDNTQSWRLLLLHIHTVNVFQCKWAFSIVACHRANWEHTWADCVVRFFYVDTWWRMFSTETLIAVNIEMAAAMKHMRHLSYLFNVDYQWKGRSNANMTICLLCVCDDSRCGRLCARFQSTFFLSFLLAFFSFPLLRIIPLGTHKCSVTDGCRCLSSPDWLE